MKHPLEKEKGIIQLIESWNVKFPFDLKWRKKYNIPFGSETHRNMSLFDIKFDIQETKYLEYLVSINKNDGKDNQQLLKSKVVEESKKLSDDEFENLNLDEFNNG